MHELDDPNPLFLEQFRRGEVRKASEGLWRFAWKLVATHRHSIYGSIQPEDLEDIVEDVCLHLIEGPLGKYEDRGKPFSKWLTTCLVRKVLEWKRKNRRTEPLDPRADDGGERPAPRQFAVSSRGRDPLLEAKLRECAEKLPGPMAEALWLNASGYQPLDLLALFDWAEGWDNKKMGTFLSEARRKVRDCLEGKGIDLNEGWSSDS